MAETVTQLRGIDLKHRAGRNRTVFLKPEDRARLRPRLLSSTNIKESELPLCGSIHGDCLEIAKSLPHAFVDLLVLDPPYNLSKDFHGVKFAKRAVHEYTSWLGNLLKTLKPLLKQTASVYICGDWLSSVSIYEAASEHFVVRNRITWEREKGRGAKNNWKNSSEDLWFCTMSEDYAFNVDAVKLRRKVIAPYRNTDGSPKDWKSTENGDFRDTHPSNIWNDITVPFWSMPENTDHPTQKSEKLLAKIVLASSHPNDFILDPFLGSGTTSVVAKKLGRKYLGIDLNEEYCLLAERRLELAASDNRVQGLADGVFWERNTLSIQLGERTEDAYGRRQIALDLGGDSVHSEP
jgi:site-specific DNA-methyltransferase (adenine-specific)